MHNGTNIFYGRSTVLENKCSATVVRLDLESFWSSDIAKKEQTFI